MPIDQMPGHLTAMEAIQIADSGAQRPWRQWTIAIARCRSANSFHQTQELKPTVKIELFALFFDNSRQGIGHNNTVRLAAPSENRAPLWKAFGPQCPKDKMASRRKLSLEAFQTR